MRTGRINLTHRNLSTTGPGTCTPSAGTSENNNNHNTGVNPFFKHIYIYIYSTMASSLYSTNVFFAIMDVGRWWQSRVFRTVQLGRGVVAPGKSVGQVLFVLHMSQPRVHLQLRRHRPTRRTVVFLARQLKPKQVRLDFTML